MIAATRVGWCPGALRPMASGDGLLVRVKPRGGILTLDQAAGLARLAESCGNGHLDCTGRANLQVRGVSEPTLGALHRGLDRLGLLDPDPDVEAVRNIVASPLAGLDPRAAVDIRPVMAALEHRLVSEPVFRLMPSKWSIVVDDGGSLGLDDVSADVRLVFSTAGRVFMGVGGAWAMLPAGKTLDAVSGLARLVAVRRPVRMRNLVATVGTEALFEAAGLPQTDVEPPRREPVTLEALLGPQPDGRFIGTAPPFGSLTAEALLRLMEAARRGGAQDIRLTPWRVMLMTLATSASSSQVKRGAPCGAAAPSTPSGSPPRLDADLTRLGMITDVSDPRLRVVACTGAPGCHRATVPTRADAGRLANEFGPGTAIGVHVSGCSKGCARPAATPWTLVGRDGRYDLVRDGRAGDTPVAQGLSFAAAAAWVRGAMPVSAP